MTYLLLRLSSLGNVAMTVPVVASLSARYPDDDFIVVAKKSLGAMFYGMKNVTFHEFTHTEGLAGLLALHHELQNYGVDVVIDLQDVLRTKILRTLMRLRGARIYKVNYGRAEKKKLTLTGHKGAAALKSEFKRYQEVLAEAGLETDDSFVSLEVNTDAREMVTRRFGSPSGHWIGIAPFAKSKSNMLPYRVTKELIQHYCSQPDTRIFLFGAGKIESEMLHQWASVFENVVSVAGMLPLEEELELMRMLEVMICMDSANQHICSLVGLRAVSVWCGTHPKMGFTSWKQDPNDIIEDNKLRCRPCTIHGTNSCRYRNFACRAIPPGVIIEKVQSDKERK